jgi:hypothetical protein
MNKFIVFLCCVLAIGCGSGGGGSGGSSESKVTEVDVSDSILEVGDISDVAVRFSYSAVAVFSEDENVNLAIKLPIGVAYVQDSAELDTVVDEERKSVETTTCFNGETILTLVLDEDDLLKASNPDGNADAEIRFKVKATSSTGGISQVQSRASDKQQLEECREAFASDAEGEIVVVE